MAFRERVKKFNIDRDEDREECEKVLTMYGPRGLGRILQHETHFDAKSGMYYVALHWYEDMPDDEYRD